MAGAAVRQRMRGVVGDVVHRFAIMSFLVLVVATSGLGWLVGDMIGDHERELAVAESLGAAQASAAAVGALGVDVDALHPRHLARLAELVGPAFERLGEIDFIVYDETGRIALALDPTLVGSQPDHGMEAVQTVLATREPLTGIVEHGSEEHELSGMTLLETRVPIVIEDRTFVLEIVQPYSPIAARITRARLAAVAVLALTLLVLWATLMPLLRRTRRRLHEQNDDLRHLLDREQANVARLQELDRTKSAILTAVSHELRTPLTAVRGMLATLARRGSALTAEQRIQLIERANANAARLQDLLADLLDVDRLSRGTVEAKCRPVELAELVGRVADQFEGVAHPLHLPQREVTAQADPALVERIVENLLANAMKYTPPGTPIWAQALEEEDGALLVVEDAGPGIPPDSRAAVFEPFHRLDPSHPSPGAGIGLTLVAELARLHGGFARVKERKGGGARFEVWFPNEPGSTGRGPGPLLEMAPASA